MIHRLCRSSRYPTEHDVEARVTPDEAFLRIKDALVDELGVPPESVVTSARLVEDLEMDSLDRVEMLAVLEGQMGRTVDQEIAERARTVGDLVDLVVELDGRGADSTSS